METSVSTIRVAIYARQSVKQDEGIDRQIATCRAMIAARDDLQEVAVFDDNATSASKVRGEGTDWAAMLTAFDRGEFDAVIVVAVDRLLRRLVDIVELREPRRPREVRIITARDGIDTGQGLGRTLLAILVALAEGEIIAKEARDLPARVERHDAGTPTPGKPPYGYRWVPKHIRKLRGSERRYDVDPEEAVILRRIFNEALAGVPLGAICRGLNDEALRMRQPRAEEGQAPREGAPWRSSTVRRILLSPLYAGMLPPVVPMKERALTRAGTPRTYRAEEVDLDSCIAGDWEPLVTLDELRVVRRALMRPDRRTNGGDTSRKHLLSGLARCGAILGPGRGTHPEESMKVCGEPVRSAWTREKHRAYRCPAGHFLRRADVIDGWAAATVVERLSRPDAASLVRQSPGVDLAALRVAEGSLDARRADVLGLVAAGRFTMSEAVAHLDPIDADLAQVRTALADTLRADPLAEAVTAGDVAAYWERLSLARRRLVLAALFEPILLPVGKGWRVVAEAAQGRQLDVDKTVFPSWRRNVEGAGGTWEHPITERARRAISAA
jgi:site-specific DNA recombinase